LVASKEQVRVLIQEEEVESEHSEENPEVPWEEGVQSAARRRIGG
jgi:hypothetical protein